MSINQTIKKLTSLENRLGLGEEKASSLLSGLLDNLSVKHTIQSFSSQTPNFIKAELVVDGKNIDCLPCGLVSGEINDNSNLISSLTSSQDFLRTPNINFNPKSDAICLSNFYFAPALAISRLDVEKVIRARNIKGVVKVKPVDYTAKNILCGNTTNPTHIIFAHYDSYFAGATDNAAGVAVLLDLVQKNRQLLESILFVFAGNEELSYDQPIYWGRCFRQFNEANPGLLAQAKGVLVVDSVGDGPPIAERDPGLINLAFPLGDFPEIIAKTAIVTGDFNSLMTVYHSAADIIGRLSNKHLADTALLLEQLLVD